MGFAFGPPAVFRFEHPLPLSRFPLRGLKIVPTLTSLFILSNSLLVHSTLFWTAYSHILQHCKIKRRANASVHDTLATGVLMRALDHRKCSKFPILVLQDTVLMCAKTCKVCCETPAYSCEDKTGKSRSPLSSHFQVSFRPARPLPGPEVPLQGPGMATIAFAELPTDLRTL